MEWSVAWQTFLSICTVAGGVWALVAFYKWAQAARSALQESLNTIQDQGEKLLALEAPIIDLGATNQSARSDVGFWLQLRLIELREFATTFALFAVLSGFLVLAGVIAILQSPRTMPISIIGAVVFIGGVTSLAWSVHQYTSIQLVMHSYVQRYIALWLEPVVKRALKKVEQRPSGGPPKRSPVVKGQDESHPGDGSE